MSDVDPQLVSLMSTYRVGFLAPTKGSLVAGELYVEVPQDGSAPRLWIGGLSDDIAPATPSAPINLDVPYVSQTEDILTCTMGNWTGTPTVYSYRWESDGATVGADADTYTLMSPDIGTTFTCTVSATNDLGTTTAPPSNSVVAT